jgi:hypothetical protein
MISLLGFLLLSQTSSATLPSKFICLSAPYIRKVIEKSVWVISCGSKMTFHSLFFKTSHLHRSSKSDINLRGRKPTKITKKITI